MSQKKETIVLTQEEFCKLLILNEFIQFTFVYNNSVRFYIHEYCNQYEYTCKNNSLSVLDLTWFTQPRDIRPPINYFRLFCEILYNRNIKCE